MFERTLIITPHFDDETIGCGGLIASLSENPKNSILIVVVAESSDTYNLVADRKVSNEERIKECREAMDELNAFADLRVSQLHGFEDGRLDQCSLKDLVSSLDNVIRDFKPTAVLFPYSSHHQDHQVVYRASIAALRPTLDTSFIKLRAMYEYPYINSWSSNLNPNSKLYYPLEPIHMLRKRSALLKYKSQLDREDEDILSIDSIITLANVRGKEIGVRYAEVFYPMNIVVEREGLI